MGQRADALEREILAARERMGQTIEQLEREFRQSMDWRTRVRQNPAPYVVGGAVVLYLALGGPRRTAGFLRARRPRPKTRLDKLIEQLPEPLAARLALPVQEAEIKLEDVPQELRKIVRQAQKERERQVKREEEQRLRAVAKATMWERVLVRAAEAAGTAAAAAAVKVVSDRLLSRRQAG